MKILEIIANVLFPLLAEWIELITTLAEWRWSLLLINTNIELSPTLHKCPAPVMNVIVLIWPQSIDLCEPLESWGLGLELSLGMQTSSFQWFMQFYQPKALKWWTITNTKQLFLFCRFGKLFVVLGCETFEFLMTLEALNFVLVYWLAPN